MEITQTPAPPLSIPVSPGLPLSSTALIPGTRFHGDGVRYKAKLIGIDHVTSAEGEKMCWDSMMKLKGFEAAFRKQGRHKQRVWLKICSSGVRILEERTGAEMYAHEKRDISAVTRDDSDPRALAYIYRNVDKYYLFYLRMANLAEHVVNDIREVCRAIDEEPAQETPQEPPPQSNALLVLEEASSLRSEETPLEKVFSPRPDTVSNESQQESSSSELMQVFAVQMKDPMDPSVCPSAVAAPEPVLEPPKPVLSKTQILSMFAPQSVGGAVYPPASWAQEGIVGNQWAGVMGMPAVSPYPSLPGSIPAWPSAVPPSGHVLKNTPSPDNADGPQTPNATPPVPSTQPNLLFQQIQEGLSADLHQEGPRLQTYTRRGLRKHFKEESVDVKALRARFNNSSPNSESPKSPCPALAKPFSSIPDSNTPPRHNLSPTVLGPSRAPPQSGLKSSPSLFSPPSVFHSGPLQPPAISPDSNKVRQTGELLQNMMLRHQRPAGPRLSPVSPPALPGPAVVPVRHHTVPPMGTPLRPQPKQRSGDDVAPLQRPLPPHAPIPPKPKRPTHVNLEPYKKFARRAPPSSVTTPLGPRTSSVSPLPAGRHVQVPCAPGAPKLPQRDIKPGRLPRQTTTVDDQETYDDIGSLEKTDSWSDTGSLSKEEDADEVYEYIDEDQVEQIRAVAERPKEERPELKPELKLEVKPELKPEVKPSKKEMKRIQEHERRETQEKQRKEEQLRKNFQLQGEVEVLHTASVRHDWGGGGKLDLSVRQGDRVDIIRVKNNPGGKWLARSTSGNYGYISNACVDIDYDAIKRKATQIRRREGFEVGELPPPPPDPPGYNSHSNGQNSESQDEGDYDDVDANPGSGWSSQDFPPPPIELNIDPKIEKELRKKFKFEQPLKVQTTMMVDPNAIIKKPGAKDLSVAPGDVLDIIQLHSKKALCRNKFGKFGYVNRPLLLPMEGDIYDDVEYPNDVYDNDNVDY